MPVYDLTEAPFNFGSDFDTIEQRPRLYRELDENSFAIIAYHAGVWKKPTTSVPAAVSFNLLWAGLLINA